MIKSLIIAALLVLGPVVSSASNLLVVRPVGQLLKVEADARHGFNFPFFLYVPAPGGGEKNLLVMPNNSGMASDFNVQLESAQRQALSWGDLATHSSSILLVPVFPRADVEPAIYTHALSRNTLLVKDGPLKRIDLQLLKMIEASRTIVANRNHIRLRKQILMFGFSASAMFVNRFAILHPEGVRAVAFGAPGGWPLAPIKEYKDKTLPYPIGVADTLDLSGAEINFEALRKVNFFAFIGSKDENDSVIFRDGYTKENQELIFSLFGKTPIERWPVAEKIYKDAGMKSRFKIYAGLGHETNKSIQDDVVQFFDGVPVE